MARTREIPKIAAPDFCRDLDLTNDEVDALLDLSAAVKRGPRAYSQVLAGRSIALLFEKPSLRTRLTFELAIKQLGGDCVSSVGPIGGREPVEDIARNLDRWVDAIVARTFSQEIIDGLARWSSAPVINALSDRFHPCQALADVFTLQERFGRLRGLNLVFAGDGNNVAHSLMLTAARLGIHFTHACPPGYEPDPAVLSAAEGLAATSGSCVRVLSDPVEAVRNADAVYTDVWASMGQEGESERRRAAFGPYQVNARLMSRAAPHAVFLHCLPARRGEEVTGEVIESTRSVVFDQAENRLHTQKALLLMLLVQ